MSTVRNDNIRPDQSGPEEVPAESGGTAKALPGTQDETQSKKRKNRWLELIAAYKLLQSLFLVAVGVGALKLLHQDLDDVLTNLALSLRMNPEGRMVSFLLDKAALLDDHKLRQISLFLFCYAAVGILEGIGLLLEKVWAEYLTAIITASFLPLEILELTHKVTAFRVGLLVANLAVLAYLVGHLVRRRLVRGVLA